MPVRPPTFRPSMKAIAASSGGVIWNSSVADAPPVSGAAASVDADFGCPRPHAPHWRPGSGVFALGGGRHGRLPRSRNFRKGRGSRRGRYPWVGESEDPERAEQGSSGSHADKPGAPAARRRRRSGRDCSPAFPKASPETIIDQCSRRMSIEESFRDLKNERLGLGFSASRSRSGKRLEILLVILKTSVSRERLPLATCAQDINNRLEEQSGFFGLAPTASLTGVAPIRHSLADRNQWLNTLPEFLGYFP